MKQIFFFPFSVFLSDVRFGARLLLKSPLTTAAAILSLALGIGGTTTMRYIEALLYEVKPGDPSTMALSGAVLMAVALLASYVPIRRMLQLNPLASLKND